MKTWFIFEGILCTDLGINRNEWAKAQQIATIVPSGTLYKIDKGPIVLGNASEIKKERIIKAIKETLVSQYLDISYVSLSRLYYSYKTRKIMCLIEAETQKEGLSSVLYINDGNNEFNIDIINLTYQYEKEYKGLPILSIYNLPSKIDIRPALMDQQESP